MKLIMKLGAMVLAACLASGLAAAADAPGKKPAPMSSGPQGGSASDRAWAQMQQNMTRMYQQMNRLPQAKTGAERDKLLAEHWQLMQQNMQAMHASGGPMMQGMGMAVGAGEAHGPGMMGRQGSGIQGMLGRGPGGAIEHMTPGQRDEYFQRRMDSMQMMMEQLMQHQQWQSAPPGK